MRGIKRNVLVLAVTALVSGLIVQGAPAAMAKDGDVIRTGSCSDASDWKLNLSPEDGRLEVEFEVHQNRNGESWRVVMKDNDDRFFKGQRTTKAPSGSFSVEKVTNNKKGEDRVVARATNLRTGETCKGTATF
jgi:hypothetical protein